MNFQTIKYFMGVSMPYMLTFASLNMVIIVGINGVPGNFMGSILKVDLTNLQIPSSDFTALTGLTVTSTNNITASSIGLDEKYSFYLWNYASTPSEGKENFHDKNIDYVDKINTSTITIDGVTNGLPSELSDIKSGFRNKIRFSEYIFLATVCNAFLVLIVGVAACFGKKFRLKIVFFFTAITFVMMLVFAALITAAGLGTNGDLDKFKDFGLKSETGTSDLGVVWMAVVHMAAVIIIWTLQAFGLMKMNPSILTPERVYDEELLSQQSPESYSMPESTRK